MQSDTQRRLVVIDGNSLACRAFYATPSLRRSDGLPTGAVSTFSSMLLRVLREEPTAGAQYRVVAFDSRTRTWRHDLSPDYKAHRGPQDRTLADQLPLCRRAAKAFGFAALDAPGYEADDIIATYVSRAVASGIEAVMVSSDKDMMQLIRPGVSQVVLPAWRLIGPREVRERWGVPPGRLADLLALTGDEVDGIAGVRGVGKKTAAELLTHVDLEGVLAMAEGGSGHSAVLAKIRDAADTVRLARRLVALREDVPVPPLRRAEFDPAAALDFCEEFELRRLAREIE